MALQKITEDPVPYYKRKGFIGPVLPEYLEYMEKQPLPKISTGTGIQYSNKLQSNKAPIPQRVGPVIQQRKSMDWKAILQKAKQGSDMVLPFATNIINAFRTPPPVPMPNLDSPVTLQKVNLDNDRYEVEKGIKAANDNANARLDENTAAAVSAYNLAQRFNQLSAISQKERNENTQISNQEALTNASIRASNNAKLDQRDVNIVERKMAMQRENSQNFANAVDKKLMIDNERAKADLDLKKFGILMKAYNRDGVASREFSGLSELQDDPIGASFYGNKASEAQLDVLGKATEDYKKRNAERRKRWKEETNEFLLSKKKYGGTMKYSTGGMIKSFKGQKIC